MTIAGRRNAGECHVANLAAHDATTVPAFDTNSVPRRAFDAEAAEFHVLRPRAVDDRFGIHGKRHMVVLQALGRDKVEHVPSSRSKYHSPGASNSSSKFTAK